MHKYARDAYELGVRYIGGCCGFEPYHIRAVAEELAAERGCKPEGSVKHDMWGGGLRMHTKPWVRARLVINVNHFITSQLYRPSIMRSTTTVFFMRQLFCDTGLTVTTGRT